MGKFGVLEIILILSIWIPFFIGNCFYLLTLKNTLREVSIENRKMNTNQVWLALIPVFGLIWNFIIVNRVADSLQLEFNKRGIPLNDKRPGITIGIFYSIFSCMFFIPLFSLFTLIFWIIYWININKLRKQLIVN